MSVFTTTLTKGKIDTPADFARKADVAAIDATKHTIRAGTKALRPTLTTTDKGVMYFATDHGINGTPLWWNGTAWVDATSVVVA